MSTGNTYGRDLQRAFKTRAQQKVKATESLRWVHTFTSRLLRRDAREHWNCHSCGRPMLYTYVVSSGLEPEIHQHAPHHNIILITKTLIESSKAMKPRKQHCRLCAAFLGFRKAFDNTPLEILWQHLSSTGNRKDMLAALKAYYADEDVRVDIPPVGTSAPFSSDTGGKQGPPYSHCCLGCT